MLRALASRRPVAVARLPRLTLDRVGEEGAAETLGLALVVFGALLDFAEPIIRHGLAAEVAEIIDRALRP